MRLPEWIDMRFEKFSGSEAGKWIRSENLSMLKGLQTWLHIHAVITDQTQDVREP